MLKTFLWVLISCFYLQTQEQLEKILDFVNSSCVMRNYRIFKNGLFQFSFTLLVGLTITFLYTTIGLLDSFVDRDTDGVWTVHIAPGALFGIVSYFLVLFIIRKVRKKVILCFSRPYVKLSNLSDIEMLTIEFLS